MRVYAWKTGEFAWSNINTLHLHTNACPCLIYLLSVNGWPIFIKNSILKIPVTDLHVPPAFLLPAWLSRFIWLCVWRVITGWCWRNGLAGKFTNILCCLGRSYKCSQERPNIITCNLRTMCLAPYSTALNQICLWFSTLSLFFICHFQNWFHKHYGTILND